MTKIQNRDHDGGAADSFFKCNQSEPIHSTQNRSPLRPKRAIETYWHCLRATEPEFCNRAVPMSAPLWSYLTSKYATFELRSPLDTNGLPKFRRHRIREGRFGEAPPSNHTFFAEVGCSGRKRTFPLPGSAKNADFSTFSELFAPRLLPERRRSIKSAQNSYFFCVRSIRHTTTRIPGRSRSIPSIWDSGFV